MVVSLVYRAEDPLLPRTFFRRFLGLTAIVGLWALCGLFLPEHFLSTVTPLLYFAVSLATIVFYLDEPSDLRAAYGLTGRQWTLSGVLLLLFLALLVVRAVANNLITGTPQAAFTAVSFSSLFLLLPSFFLHFSSFFGERVRLADLSSAGIADEIGANPRRLALWGPVGPLAPSLQLVI